jgi:peptidyl-prolyl cis-trans isomerase C
MSPRHSQGTEPYPLERTRNVIRTTARAALAVLAASLLLAGCSPAGKPLARVGTRTVTSADFLDAIRGNEMQYPGAPEAAKKAALQDLVRRELMLEAARSSGLDTTVYSRNFLETLTDRITLETLYGQLAPKDPGVTEAEAKRLYDWRGIKATTHLIYSPDRPVIDAAEAELRRGEPFAAVADRFNLPGSLPPGGAIGPMAPGSLVPPLDGALLSLPLNKPGGPYETPQGFFILMVSQRDSATDRPPYEIAQGQLLDMVRQRKTRQVMNTSLVALRDAYHGKLEPGGATALFRLLTPSRVGDTPIPNPTPAERAEVLTRWDGGTYTLGDAMADLQRPDVQKPSASMTPAIEQWLRSQMLTRIVRAEAKRRHLADEPAVARRIKGEFERYLLEGEFQRQVAGITTPDEQTVLRVWDMMKGQYQQLQRANVQWVVLPDSASVSRLAMHAGRGGTLQEAVRMAGLSVPVHQEVLAFPTSDPNWVTMRETLMRMQPGQWAGPEQLPGGFRIFQLTDKVQGELTLDKLTPDMRASLESNALQMAREQRLVQYTDSLQAALRPNLYVENLASLPWPPPAPIDVGR